MKSLGQGATLPEVFARANVLGVVVDAGEVCSVNSRARCCDRQGGEFVGGEETVPARAPEGVRVDLPAGQGSSLALCPW
jgi:hypothetical protein